MKKVNKNITCISKFATVKSKELIVAKRKERQAKEREKSERRDRSEKRETSERRERIKERKNIEAF